MRIYFEEHLYKATEEVIKDLRDICVLQDMKKRISVSYVGYYYSKEVGDCVFILPKVLLKDEKIVDTDGKTQTVEVVANVMSPSGEFVTPENIINKEGQEKYLSPEYKKFIYEFAVWIYRALSTYRKLNEDSSIIYYHRLPREGRGRRHQAETYLDIVLSLIRFNEENQDFFLFTIKNLHSGMNKINWAKTISKTAAFVRKKKVMYLNPVNKKRLINFDEELFIIFFRCDEFF